MTAFKKSFINPLTAHRDELRELHVNTYVPQVIAAARRYEISSIIGLNLRVGAPHPSNTVPPIPDIDIPSFKAASDEPASWIKPADKPLTFRTPNQAKNVDLVPLYQLFDRRYVAYWRVS